MLVPFPIKVNWHLLIYSLRVLPGDTRKLNDLPRVPQPGCVRGEIFKASQASCLQCFNPLDQNVESSLWVP